MSAIRKNVASQVVTFALVNATTGAALTGATVTARVTLDGTQSSGAGTVTELGSGQYKYAPTQAETNGASIGFLFTATNAVPVNLQAYTTADNPATTTAALVWGETLPGTYGSTTAGGILGRFDSSWATSTGPVAVDGDVTVIQGDDYNELENSGLHWFIDPGVLDWNGATVVFNSNQGGTLFTKAMTLDDAGSGSVYLSLTDTETAAMPAGEHRYDVRVTLSGGDVYTPLHNGKMTVLARQT